MKHIDSQRWIYFSIIGFILGAGGAKWHTSQVSHKTSESATTSLFDKATFAESNDSDSVIMLTKNLPQADATKCAAIANAMLAKHSNGKPLAENVWEGLYKRWMQVSPKTAWAFVEKHHSDELPLRIVALRQWALLDPYAAVAATGEGITAEEQATIAFACVEGEPRIGLDLLVKWRTDLADTRNPDPFSSLELIVGELLTKLAEKSPKQAMEWCQTHAPDEIFSVCQGWMRVDENSCLAWISSQDITKQRDLLNELCEEPDVSASVVRKLADLCEPEKILFWVRYGLEHIATRDSELAQSLIDELFPNPMDRMVARCEMAEEFSRNDPRKAMELLLPSLRTPLPMNVEPVPHLQWYVPPTHPEDEGPDYFGIVNVLGDYLNLGKAGGVGKPEVLSLLREIHPQYHFVLLLHNIYELTEILGPPKDWALPFISNMPREKMHELVSESYMIETADEALQIIQALPPETLRDVMSEHYLQFMLDTNEPVDRVLEKAQELGGTSLDLSPIYAAWVDDEPAAAFQHLLSNPEAKKSEWSALIKSGYDQNEIQDAVVNMSDSSVRHAAVELLAAAAISEGKDVVSSMYWATEIADRGARHKQMKHTWHIWQNDKKASNDPAIANAVRHNIENSSLDTREKALWLERIGSEDSP